LVVPKWKIPKWNGSKMDELEKSNINSNINMIDYKKLRNELNINQASNEENGII
jgi:hypothetical protein